MSKVQTLKQEIEHLSTLRQALTELGIDFEEKDLNNVEYSKEVTSKYLEITGKRKIKEAEEREINEKKIVDTQNRRAKKLSQKEILIPSNVPEKRIKFVINSNSYVEVHEDNMAFYNVILKKYQQIYKKNFVRISRTVHNTAIINRAKRLGYNIEQTKFSNNNVRFVLKNDNVRQKKAELV